MITAQEAWELAEATNGKFRLGLGPQVRAHIERRFGAAYDSPGPRLREYIQAVRACFAAFRGEPLQHQGKYWNLSLLPDFWSPGPLEVPDPPIDIAAVNPWMLRMAGAVADGIHVHPLNTRQYLCDQVKAEVALGAATTGRSPDDIQLIVPVIAAPGANADDQHRLREAARELVAWYASTPNYAFFFEQLGREGTTQRVREKQRAGDVAGMVAAIDDDLLDNFCLSGDFGEVSDQIVARHHGVADRAAMFLAHFDWERDDKALRPWGELARDVITRTDG
jgi:probable F420-dependent oxidoreductase